MLARFTFAAFFLFCALICISTKGKGILSPAYAATRDAFLLALFILSLVINFYFFIFFLKTFRRFSRWDKYWSRFLRFSRLRKEAAAGQTPGVVICKITAKPSEIIVKPQDRLFMQKLFSVAEAHMADESFSVAQLGREVNMSPSQVNRKLKRFINQSAQQFIRSVRMQRAGELVKNQAGTVSEIAYQVGFNDPGYFTRVFKMHFGYLPSEAKNRASGA
jgi:AraC-like DNA-binding protein